VKNNLVVVFSNPCRWGELVVPTSRSYGDACGIARALDVVGERWALLVVRELLLGPLRFSDLRRALPRASSNLVADRLRELDGHGVVRRRKLAAPAGSWVYELTEWGHELEPIVLALGGWGLRVPLPPEPMLSATSVLLFLRGSARPDPAAPTAVFRLELDDRVWSVRSSSGRVDIRPGEPPAADVRLRTDARTLNALLDEPAMLDACLSDGTVVAAGDLTALRTLLQAVIHPRPAAGSVVNV
jgi:DNA-binding HxlR family transcriptional regulator